MAQINIILFIPSNTRSFIIAKATRISAKGLSGISIWTPFFLKNVSQVEWVIFYYKTVFIGLSTFNFFKQRSSEQTLQRKPLMPPRGLATNYNSRSGNKFLNWLEIETCGKEKGGMKKQIQLFQGISHPAALLQRPNHSQWNELEAAENHTRWNPPTHFLSALQRTSGWFSLCSTSWLVPHVVGILLIT